MNEPLKVPELKPCPFCGSEAHTFPSKYSDVTLWNARCKNCYAAHDGHISEKSAIENWQRRASDAEIARLTAELQAARARVEALSKPVSDEEVFKHRSHAQNGGFGTKDGLLNKDAISALIASRVAPEGEHGG
jgi:Lar family restriction alleviation protein